MAKSVKSFHVVLLRKQSGHFIIINDLDIASMDDLNYACNTISQCISSGHSNINKNDLKQFVQL